MAPGFERLMEVVIEVPISLLVSEFFFGWLVGFRGILVSEFLVFFSQDFFFFLSRWLASKKSPTKIRLKVDLFDPLEKGHVFCKRPGDFSMKRA